MRLLKLVLWNVILVLISACGGGSTSEPKPLVGDEFSVSNQSTSELFEGSIGEIVISANSTSSYSITIEQTSGPLTYFREAIVNKVEFIAPNVSEDQAIEFTIKVTTEQNEQATFNRKVTVKNRIIASLSQQPKPNVFSTPNLSKHQSRKFDSSDVPLYEKDGEDYYYPVNVAQYAYDLYNHFERYQTDESLDKFLANATWLRDNCVYTDYGFCSYRAYFQLDAYKLTTDWTTAMGQGQAISSLIAAHYITGDESFAQVAYDAVSAFNYPISVKGLAADFEGVIWYEEYGSEEMPAHVLNGFLFSLSGVNDFYKYYQEDYAKEIFDTGVDSLENNIHLFDFDFTSRYDYSPLNQLASTKGGPDAYHEIHIFQLAWIVSETESQIIKDAAQKFLMQDMAGIKSIKGYEDRSKDIVSIVASHTIDSVNFGVNKLTDANWTWDKYWSSHRSGTTLTIELHDNVLDAGVLSKLVMTSQVESDFPREFDIFELNEDGQQTLLKAGITVANGAEVEYKHETGGFHSYTVVFNLELPINSNQILVKFYGAEGGTVKLRELDVHYPREALLNDIVEAYRAKK